MKSYVWYNRMSLLKQYENCIGGKNGYTPNAGKTLVSYAKKNSMVLTIVSLDDENHYQNHQNLFEYYFSKYQLYTIVDKNQFSVPYSFFSHDVYLKQSFQYPLKEEEVQNIQTLLSYHSLQRNQSIGNVTIYLNREIIGKVSLYQKEKKKTKKSLSLVQKVRDLLLR